MKKKFDIIISILIIILEIYAFTRMIRREHVIDFEYYTVLSNALAFLTSIFYLLLYKRRTSFFDNFYFIVTCMMCLTFLIVLFVLIPMYNFDFYWLMLKGSNLMMHTLCPLLMITLYIFYNKTKSNKYLVFVPIIIYGIPMIILNITKTFNGPYPFLKVYEQKIYMTIIWILIIFVVNYIIGTILIKLNRKLGVNYEYKDRESM